MPHSALIAMGLMVAAGVIIAVQAPINAALGRGLGSPFAAATVSFGVGFVLLLLLSLFTGDARAIAALPSVPLWLLVGGAMGAFFVFSALWSVPLLGVLTVTGLGVLGQIGAALVLDHYGAFGLPVREISPTRLLSGAMLIGGVILSRI